MGLVFGLWQNSEEGQGMMVSPAFKIISSHLSWLEGERKRVDINSMPTGHNLG